VRDCLRVGSCAMVFSDCFRVVAWAIAMVLTGTDCASLAESTATTKLSTSNKVVKTESSKSSKGVKPSAKDEWYEILKQSEQLLAQGKFSDGANHYIKALTAAETAHVRCGEERFVELIAVGDEITVRGSKPVRADSSSIVAEDNKLTETVLDARERAAQAVCGADSAAVVASWQGKLLHYNMIQNKALALTMQKKLIAAPALGKFDEVELYHKACAARSSAYMNKQVSRAANKPASPPE
jgi:hypothetical protein